MSATLRLAAWPQPELVVSTDSSHVHIELLKTWNLVLTPDEAEALSVLLRRAAGNVDHWQAKAEAGR